jgi:hypothetical protein
MHISSWQKLLSVCVCGGMLLFAACGSTTAPGTTTASGQGTSTSGTAAATPTQPAQPTATSLPPTATPVPTCANVLPGAAAVGTITSFADIPFPSGSVEANMQETAAGAGLFQILQYDICFTGQVSDVNGPFSAHQSIFAQLLGKGWGQGNPSGFPYDGQLIGGCHAQPDFCLTTSLTDAQSGNTERFAAFEHITDHGNSTITFHLRLALPPAVPNCPPGPPVNFVSFYPNHNGSPLPLPPLSSLGIAFGSSAYQSTHMCSAGTAPSVSTFFATELAQLGWHMGTIHLANNLNCTNTNHTFTGWIDPANKYGVEIDTSNTAGSDLNPGRSWILGVCG